MEKLSKEILNIIKDEIWQYCETDASNIQFSQEVVNACKANLCGNYNKSWRCPPNVGEFSVLKAKYSEYGKVFVFTTVHNIEDSFDIEGMFEACKRHNRTEDKIRKLVKEYNGEVLGAGVCDVCEKCAFPNPCRFPERAKTSVEACGIDVVALASTLGINYVNGENTVTYFSAVFF